MGVAISRTCRVGVDVSVDDSLQTRVAAVLLAAIDDAGFVLAGAGAIRAHGLTARPTYDVDLFASSTLSEPAFATAVQTGARALIDSGLQVTVVRSARCSPDYSLSRPAGKRSRSTSVSTGAKSRRSDLRWARCCHP